jgi:hypothetical protein
VKLAGVQEHLIRRHAEERGGSQEQRVPALGRADVRKWSDGEERQRRDGKPDEGQADDAQARGRHPDRRERARPHHNNS